jgi:hypothetical protein
MTAASFPSSDGSYILCGQPALLSLENSPLKNLVSGALARVAARMCRVRR